jgi:hypothetical protein
MDSRIYEVGETLATSNTITELSKYCSVYSRCYATIVRWTVISETFLGNGSVNTLPRQRGKRGIVYAVRAKEMEIVGTASSVGSWQSVLYGT